jgi:hypothetical protein
VPNTWTLISVQKVPAASNLWGRLIVQTLGGTIFGVNDYLDVDSCLLENSDTVNSYFSGNTASTETKKYSWTDTPNVSTSIETSVVLGVDIDTARREYRQLAVGTSNLSINDLRKKFLELKLGANNRSADGMAKDYWGAKANAATDLTARYDTSVRTNWCTSPNQVNPSPGYSVQTLASVTGIVGHPSGITTATRVSWSGVGTNPGIVIGAPIQDGHTYTISAWIYLETALDGTYGFAQQGVGANTVTIIQGQWVRVSMTRKASGTNNYGFRTTNPAASGSYLVTGVLLEESSTMLPLFDPNAPAAGEVITRWVGAIEGSYNQWFKSNLSVEDYKNIVFNSYQGEELLWLQARP